VAETGAEINIEDDGSVHIYATSGESMARAKEIIGGMTKEIEIGNDLSGARCFHQRVRRLCRSSAGQGRTRPISELPTSGSNGPKTWSKPVTRSGSNASGSMTKAGSNFSKSRAKERAEKETGQPAPAETH